jgi:hypothetical protein
MAGQVFISTYVKKFPKNHGWASFLYVKNFQKMYIIIEFENF